MTKNMAHKTYCFAWMSSATVSLYCYTFDQVLQQEIKCFASEHVQIFAWTLRMDGKSHVVVVFCRVHASEPEALDAG